MPRIIYLFFFSLIIPHGLQSQSLSIYTTKDTIETHKEFNFSTMQAAENYINFKTDSLKKAGYPFLIENVEVKSNTLTAKLNLNQKIDSLYIRIDQDDFGLLPRDLLKEDYIEIPYTEFINLQNSILTQLKTRGLSFAKIYLKNLKLKGNAVVSAQLKIEKGNKRSIDKITINGYPELSKTYISRFANLKTGDVFIEANLQDKTEQLNNIPFIEIKKPTEVLFQRDSTELFFYLEKVNANSFDGFLGFGSNEEEDFQLNGYLNMILLNNLNFGERLEIIYKNDGIGQQTFEGNINLPFIFKTPLSLSAGLRLFRRDSAFSNSSQHVNINYQLNERLSASAGVEFTNSTGLETELASTASEIDDYTSFFYELGVAFLKLGTRENFNENTFVNLKAGIGRREATSTTDQYKIKVEGQHLIELNTRNKIYINLNSQILISDNYLNNELYRFGGVNSIRGFTENSLIADRFAVLQTEFRYLLDSNLFANTVIDFGNYQNSLENINENILGYGIGIGLKSKAGIFRLVVANAVSSTQESSISNSKIHINFRSFF